MSLPAEKASLYDTHYYAITCHHVAVTGGATIIRINTHDGKSRFIETDPDDWQWIPRGDDLAAIDITEKLDRLNDTISFIQKRLFVTREIMAETELRIGEDGFMLGLFADLAGKERNLVAARFGNLSLLAVDEDPIKQGHKQKRPSHIFDIRSRPGFSGSPVFVYRTPTGDLRNSIEYRPPPRVKRMVEMTTQDVARSEEAYSARIIEGAKNQYMIRSRRMLR